MADTGLQLLPERRKKINVYVPGANKWLTLSTIALIVVALLFAGARFYKNTIVDSVHAADQSLSDLEQKRDRPTETKLILLDQRLKIANALIGEHIYWSLAFARIQNLVQPQVQMKNFSANIQDEKFVFKAEAANYPIVASQIASFLSDKDISNVSLDKVVSLPSGRLEVNMTIHMNTKKFLKAPAVSPAP